MLLQYVVFWLYVHTIMLAGEGVGENSLYAEYRNKVVSSIHTILLKIMYGEPVFSLP